MTEKWKFQIPDQELEMLIRRYCRDFCELERQGKYDPITGRDIEIEQVILILLQKGRKNACLIAPAGVGKTALVVGLAQQIVKGNVPEMLKNSRLLEIDMPSMAAGTESPAEFQERFVPLCKGVAERASHPDYPNIIMFIDEVHTIMPTVRGSAYAGLSEVMKPYLTTGDLQIIGATTHDEYRMYVELDPAMDRRFQKVPLSIPNIEETYSILQYLRPGFEKHHKIEVPDEVLLMIVHLTEEHLRKRNQPDKSIIIMDSSMAFHVKEYGTGGKMEYSSVYQMISVETRINPTAFADERYENRIQKMVADTNKTKEERERILSEKTKWENTDKAQMENEEEKQKAQKQKPKEE